MADRYFVGNGIGVGINWHRDANWSAATGGGGGAGTPTAADNAYLDANSGDCNINGGTPAVCIDFSTLGYGDTFQHLGATLTPSGTFTHRGGTYNLDGTLNINGNVLITSTWANTTGIINIEASATWTGAAECDIFNMISAAGITLTPTGSPTITVNQEFRLIGEVGANITITGGGAANYTFDLGASIGVKQSSSADIDHMQLGAADTLEVIGGTDNGNNDADITFTGGWDRTASVSGQWTNTTTWGGSAAPSSINSWIINAGVTVTLEGGPYDVGGGTVTGTLTFDGQTDGTPTPAILQLNNAFYSATLTVTPSGTIDTQNADDAGYCGIHGEDTGSSERARVQFASGATFTIGAYWTASNTCFCSPIVIATGEKITIVGDTEGLIEFDGGCEIQAGGELDSAGFTIELETGVFQVDGTLTGNPTLVVEGDATLAGTPPIIFGGMEIG